MTAFGFWIREALFGESRYARELGRERLRELLPRGRDWWGRLFTALVAGGAMATIPDGGIEDDEVIFAIRSLPRHQTGLTTVNAIVSTSYKVIQATTAQTGSVYNPVGANSVTIAKTFNFGTAAANNVSGGGDEVFSFQQPITAGSSATVDLTAMTDMALRANAAIVRVKGFQFRLLSATDDPTLSPAPTASSTVTVTNIGVAVPAALYFGNNGSGLTVTLTVGGGGAVTGVAIGAAGSGYPKSTAFIVVPQQAGGSGCIIGVVTNASGVPTSVVFITGAGGTGYAGATVPTTPAGQFPLGTGDADMHLDLSAGGVAVSATAKNLSFLNMDAVHAVTLEIDVMGASS
jgi:hypothetical protein